MSERDSRNPYCAAIGMMEQLSTPDEHGKPGASAASTSGFRSWFRPPFRNQGGLSALQFIPFYAAVGIILFFLLWTLVSYLLPPGVSKLWGELLAEAVFAVSAIAPAFAIAAIESRPFGIYGLPPRQAFGKSFWSGVIWGLVSLSVLLLLMHLFGAFSFGSLALHGLRIWKFAVFWAVFFLLVALFEEFAFRGYPLFAFSEAAGFWPSALLLSVIFGYTHRGNTGETWVGAIGAGAIGLFFCFTLRRTGNLWFAVGLHASWDWAQSFLYGVPDSGEMMPGHLLQSSLHGSRWITGGTVGPEGSVLVFVVIAGMWVVFDRMYPEKPNSPQRHRGREEPV
jgi:membrane protease YdiL (CAAX protease family)